jgi:hypothetical protein
MPTITRPTYRAYFFGRSSYAAPDYSERPDYTPASIAEARRIMESIPSDPYYPCCDEDTPEDGGPELILFAPGNDSDYPDLILSFGPRGGVVVSRT